MPASLPAESPRARSLTRVVPEILRSLDGEPAMFAPARSAVLCVVDGLGAHNLAARLGHARFLAGAGSRRDVARTVFPATTAAALTSLLTGTDPGRHGLVGYRVRVPGTDQAPNQLRGWETDGLDPLTWQRSEPLFARRASQGRASFVVSKPEYATSGFTQATLRGAEVFSERSPRDRAERAAALAAQHPGSIVYVYLPELDVVGHRSGWESDEWATVLESVDDAARALAAGLHPRDGAVITADHGMVDVPRHRQVLIGDGPLWEGVRVVAGEPRMLHLHVDGDRADEVLARWREREQSRAWVLSRDEAVDAGLFGRVDAPVRARIGDVLVAARAAVAYYDDRVADKAPQRMIGQHGSLTDQERTVPLLRLGAFA